MKTGVILAFPSPEHDLGWERNLVRGEYTEMWQSAAQS